MNALELSTIREIITKESQAILKKMKQSEDESDITISFAEAERIYDICKDADRLVSNLLRNTDVDNTSEYLPFGGI